MDRQQRARRHAGIRKLAGRARAATRFARTARRMGCDCGELHLGHHRRPQGRGHPPPGRLPQRRVQCQHLDHAAVSGVFVDAAHVPLQRLVLSVDSGHASRNACLLAQSRGRADFVGHPRTPGGPLLRRAHRAQPFDQCACQIARGHQPRGARHGGGCGAACVHDRRHGPHRY